MKHFITLIKNKCLLTLVFVSISFFANAKNDSFQTSSPYHVNHVSFNLQHGFTHGKGVSNSGILKPEPRTGYVYNFGLNYTTNYSPLLGFTFGAGFGAFPLNFNFPQVDFGKMPYFDDVIYRTFGSLKGEINFRKRIAKNYYLNVFTGLNLYFFNQQHSYGYESWSTSQPDFLYKMNIDFEGGWRPLINIGTGVSKELKNGDLLCLRMDYHHSLSQFYRGNYIAMPNTIQESEGVFYNNGHHLNLGLSYIFTFAEKFKKYQKHFKETGSTEVKKPYKMEMRKIDENSLLVSMSGGYFFPITKAKDPNGYFQTASMFGFAGLLSLEYQLKNHFYTETGFGIMEYFDALKIKGQFGTSGSNVFKAYQFNLGLGKRLTGKRNLYNYLNLSTGAILNVTDVTVGQNGIGGGISDIMEYTSVYEGKNRISPLLYLSASKDFRLSPGFYLSILYRYNQGILKIHEQRINYTTKDMNEPQHAVLSMNGSYHTAQLGFKYNMNNTDQHKVRKVKKPYDSKTTFLSINQGKVYYRTRTKPEYAFANSPYSYGMDGSASLFRVERHVNSLISTELGFGYQTLHHFSISMNFLDLSAGISRVITLKSGAELFRVHGGIALNKIIGTMDGANESLHYYNELDEMDEFIEYFYDPKSRKGYSTTVRVKENDTIYSSHTDFSVKNNLIPGIYYSLSKDFAVSQRISFGILFSNRFAFTTFYSEINQTFDQIRGKGTETTTMKGRNAQLYLSLKYRIYK